MRIAELVLFGVLLMLALTSVVLLYGAASHANRRHRIPFPLDVLADVAEVYGALWGGTLTDDSARRAVQLHLGSVVLMLIALAAFVVVAE